MPKKPTKIGSPRVSKGKRGKRPKLPNGTLRAEKSSSHARNGAVIGPCKPFLDMYRDLRALQFSSEEQFAAAGKLLWGDLSELPYDLVGNQTIIVPAVAVPCFAGLEFTDTEVLSPDDLPADELNELRRECGPC